MTASDQRGVSHLPIAHPLLYGAVPVVVPAFLVFKFLTDGAFRRSFLPAARGVYAVVSAATAAPITGARYFQHAGLLRRLWGLPSARAYIDEGTGRPVLEFQAREGFCGSATLRCVLKSLGCREDRLPAQRWGKSIPESWCEDIARIAREYAGGEKDEDGASAMELTTTIVRGDVDYDEFIEILREGLANPNVRIACNYLRSALTGFEKVRYVPTHMIVAMLGGHFSPILGMLDEEDADDETAAKRGDGCPLVAIFDTSHKYNGVYFVPARRLYEAVKAVDLSNNNNNRAIVLVEKGAQ
eukprot:CAMPEP_0117458762 /NCGR_PEP_ID=MMETSP0784-20121206/1109_1 /TAXON_ID=39447 /ORGANISM="" /LENGTH=298 /DNA_ID=CAMNT_0005252313 /DNA_START=26 /DNA_END=919 /DNA_ORIENTATION=+